VQAGSTSNMKNLFYIPLFACLFAGMQAQSQTTTRRNACSDPYILHEADSIKQELASKGYLVVKEASMTMESENEIPVIVPLTEGGWYQFVFIGDVRSRSYEVRMLDWDQKEVAYQKLQSSDPARNVISYSYIPKISEYHMMKPLQVNNDFKKNLCGYVMLLKKVTQ
jgi:hypothetical protein